MLARSINAEHKDLIHDVAYDFFGKRLATCSSDQTVKVWDLGDDGLWHCTATWKTHSGSVWKVTWAHPEFGQVLATCSFDRSAVIWEELAANTRGEHSQSQWVKRASLVDSRTSVTDVKFSPKHLGLRLATCSSDGTIRIYEALDVMNLAQWTLQIEITGKISISCLSWNPAKGHPSMIAVGSDNNSASAGGKVLIYEYNENSRRWIKVEAVTSVTEAVHDLAFAPNLGRSYHLLAIAAKDVRIISLKPMIRDQLAASVQGNLPKFEIRNIAQFDDHNSQVWRVSWNLTGTILASSGDDGCVHLWKGNYLDDWKCISTLKGDGSVSEKPGASSLMAGAGINTTRYYKLGQISNPSQVPWH